MINRRFHGPRQSGAFAVARQRGVVLFIALIVMVAMSLAAVALIRSIDTTNIVIGNLAFRQSSILPGNFIVEQAAAALFKDADPLNAGKISDLDNDLPAQNYFASRQPGEDARGVPLTLQKKSVFDSSGFGQMKQDPTSGIEMRYIIERMCIASGLALPSNCDLMPPKQALGQTANKPAAAPEQRKPFYRVTIRVDGPQNTASFMQAMLRP